MSTRIAVLAAVPADTAGSGGVLATHPIVSAVPFFVPTLIVVAVIALIVWRDRHRDDRDHEGGDRGTASSREDSEPGE
ncbi:hypothetical protein GCM10023085_43120 [Actinomadura viridis]|uniref:Uncharacterized protein n=1 Tax=Actinomadura viridis TaxID=58110 RepID=A0A931GRG7_9ACTN|nr:hypothetical protein [Actinomadura viridis]MBG6089674.1 hypothetical protein [Actinomadura viridis]